MPLPPDFNMVTLDLNPTSWQLLARDNTKPDILRGINPLANKEVSRFTCPNGRHVEGVAIDTRRNIVYVADGSPIVRELDGTSLIQHDSIVAPIGNVSGIAFDSALSQLVLVSRELQNGKVFLQRYATGTTFNLLQSLVYRVSQPLGRVILTPKDRMMILVGTSLLAVVDPSGTLQDTIQFPGGISDAAWCNATSRLYVVDATGFTGEGEHGNPGKIHWLDPSNGMRDSIKVGQHIRRMDIYQSAGILVFNSSHSNEVLLVDSRTNTLLGAIDVGESSESLAYNADSNELYIADRLGDENSVIRYNLWDGGIETYRTGNWPVSIAYDPLLKKAFSLDHLQSSVSILDDASRQTVGQLRLPNIAEARTDALSHMTYDDSGHLLLACFPEYASWMLLDMKLERPLRSGVVTGYQFNEVGGPGKLQGAIASDVDRFFILRLDERKLNVYKLSTGEQLTEVDVSSLRWNDVHQTDGALLYYDSLRKWLFIGATAFDVFASELLLDVAPRFVRIVGVTQNGNNYIGLEVAPDSIRLLLLTPNDFHVLLRRSLYPSRYGTPVTHFSAIAGKLFLAEFQYALVRQYNIDRLVNVEEVPACSSIDFYEVFPNPAGQNCTLRFHLPRAASYRLQISDALGRTKAKMNIEPNWHEFTDVTFSLRDWAEGLYYFTLSGNAFLISGTILHLQ